MAKSSDSTHEYADYITDDPTKEITVGIIRLKHHLANTKKVLRFVRKPLLM